MTRAATTMTAPRSIRSIHRAILRVRVIAASSRPFISIPGWPAARRRPTRPLRELRGVRRTS